MSSYSRRQTHYSNNQGQALQSSANLYQPNAFSAAENQQSTERPIEQQSRSNYQDDFYLLDVIGGQNVSVMHPTKPIVAYTAGCMIIVYDMISDAKIQLVNHQHEVKALAFSVVGSGGSQAGGDHLISVDSNRNDAESTAKMCLWNWARGACIQEVTLPQSHVNQAVLETSSFIIQFDRTGTLFMVIQSTQFTYRASIWSFSRHSSIDLIAHTDLDHQAGCTSAALLQTKSAGGSHSQTTSVYLNQSLSFLTLEKNCVKVWEFSHGSFELQKRIHIKQAITQVVVSELTGFLIILGDNGKVLILDQAGNFVSTVFKTGVFLTSVGVANDKLLLGTERGAILVYHMASLSYISEIPYQFSLLPDQILNHALDAPQTRNGPPTKQIELTNNLRFIKIQYADSSFVVVDRTQTSPKDAIIGHHFGHFDAITDIQWMGQHASREIDSQEQHQYSLVYQSSECFMTCATDLSVFVWRHHGDRWQFNYIDVAKCFDESLSFQRKGCDRSTAELQLTAMCIYPRRRQNIVIGDNKGSLRVFQLGKEVASHLASFTVAPNQKITRIYITENEQVAIVTFESGQISLYDVKSSFSLLGNVETGSRSTMRTQSLVVEKGTNYLHSDMYATLQGQQVGTSFKVFSQTGPNCIRAQLVDVKDGRMTKSQLVQYFIAEGSISGFDLHPSKDYILISSNRGKIYLYRIETGELRGTINIPIHAQGCLVDPSGLYVVVQVPPFSANLLSGAITVDLLGSNERSLKRTTVLMYEIGTGQAAAEILSVFDIAQMKFSNDGRYLTLGSSQGTVSVWAIGDHLYQNVRQILEAMATTKDFWYNYPIFLSDHQVVPQPVKLPTIESKQFSLEKENNKKSLNIPNPYLNYLPTNQAARPQINQMNKVSDESLVHEQIIQPSIQNQQSSMPQASYRQPPEVQVYLETPMQPGRQQQLQAHSPPTVQRMFQQQQASYIYHRDQIDATNVQQRPTISTAQQLNSPNKAQFLYQVSESVVHPPQINLQSNRDTKTAGIVPLSQPLSNYVTAASPGRIEHHRAMPEVQHVQTEKLSKTEQQKPFELYQPPQPYVERVIRQSAQTTPVSLGQDLKREPASWCQPAAPIEQPSNDPGMMTRTHLQEQTTGLNFMDRSLNDRVEVPLLATPTNQSAFKPLHQYVQYVPAPPTASNFADMCAYQAGDLYQNQEFIQRLAPIATAQQHERREAAPRVNPEPLNIDDGIVEELQQMTASLPHQNQVSFTQRKQKDDFLEDSDAICDSYNSERVEEAYNAIEDFERRRQRQQLVQMYGKVPISHIYSKQHVEP